MGSKSDFRIELMVRFEHSSTYGSRVRLEPFEESRIKKKKSNQPPDILGIMFMKLETHIKADIATSFLQIAENGAEHRIRLYVGSRVGSEPFRLATLQ